MSDQDSDRVIDRALDAWTPMEPPAGFADRVLAAQTPLASPRSKRAWWLAAPVAAAAMIAIVLFATSASKKADSPEFAYTAANDDVRDMSANGVSHQSGSGSAAPGVAMNQPVAMDAGVAQNDPVDPPAGDVVIRAGESVTVHDPAPTTSVQIGTGALCPSGATVSARGSLAPSDHATATGLTRVELSLSPGRWTYEVRCTSNPGVVAVEGTIDFVHTDRKLVLPKARILVSTIEPDGRLWRVTFHSLLPEIRVNAPGATHVHFAMDGTVTEVPVVNGVATLAHAKPGAYTFWTLTPKGRRNDDSKLIVELESAAPQVAIDSISSAPSSSGGMIVRGATMPGWTLEIDGARVDIDTKLRFSANVHGFRRVVIRAEHPQLGTHYYVTLPITK